MFRFLNDAKLLALYYIAFKHILQYSYAREIVQILSFSALKNLRPKLSF